MSTLLTNRDPRNLRPLVSCCNQLMKNALTFTALLFAFVLTGQPVVAQEHVDVPLPAYDPPPPASHHSEAQPDQPARASHQAKSAAKVSKKAPSPPDAHQLDDRALVRRRAPAQIDAGAR